MNMDDFGYEKKIHSESKKSVTDLYGLTWVGARDACASKNQRRENSQPVAMFLIELFCC